MLDVNWMIMVKNLQQVISEQGLIVTKRGLVDKHNFYFPQILLDRFDGQTLFLKKTDKDAGKYEGR
jgi:hypothetical protein